MRDGRDAGTRPTALYLQMGEHPADNDVLVGQMGTAQLARLVVEAWNAAYDDGYPATAP